MKIQLLTLAVAMGLSTNLYAEKAKLLNENAANKIPGQYIVVLKDSFNAESSAPHMERQYGGKLKQIYKKALNGFSVKLNPQQLDRLRDDHRIDYIEADATVSLNASQSPATWGLDRIDQRNLPLNNTYNYTDMGSGVRAYILDTGIYNAHSNFEGRAYSGWDFIDNDSNANDCHGHGTHVAGTVASATYGVAKNAKLYGVRVLNCQGNGSYSQIIAGVDWVANNHVKPAVANMSLGGGVSSALNTAVNNLDSAGVTVVVAAGNDSGNACNKSPASASKAYTVGSTTSSDNRSSFSNYGSCVNIFAPGSNITSTLKNGSYGSNSGTSMASPHVAGTAALYLETNPNASPSQVKSHLTNNATTGKVINPGTGSPNRLLYSIYDANPVPTMGYIFSEYVGCSGYTPQYIIDWTASSASPILEYDVDYNYWYSGNWYNIYNGTNMFLLFNGSNDTPTRIRVRARNANGWSSFKTTTLRRINCSGGGPNPQ